MLGFQLKDSHQPANTTANHEQLVDDKKCSFAGNPGLITEDPAVAMEGVDLIVLMNPAFTHFGYLRELEPYVKSGLTVVALPGQPGTLRDFSSSYGLIFHLRT